MFPTETIKQSGSTPVFIVRHPNNGALNSILWHIFLSCNNERKEKVSHPFDLPIVPYNPGGKQENMRTNFSNSHYTATADLYNEQFLALYNKVKYLHWVFSLVSGPPQAPLHVLVSSPPTIGTDIIKTNST